MIDTERQCDGEKKRERAGRKNDRHRDNVTERKRERGRGEKLIDTETK